jgi:hypothetical protein
VDALLAQRQDLVDEEHDAGVVGLHDALELVHDQLGRAHAEAAAGELLLAEDALEGAAARREDVDQALGVELEVALHRQQVPRGLGQLVELLDQRRGGVVDPDHAVADAGQAGQLLERLLVVALERPQELGQRLLALALEHVVEVPGVEEDPLVDRGVRAPHDRGLALLLGVLGPGDGAPDVRGQGAEADHVVGLDRGLHLRVVQDPLVRQGDRDPLLLQDRPEVGDPEDHRQGVLLDVRLDVGQQGLLHGVGRRRSKGLCAGRAPGPP